MKQYGTLRRQDSGVDEDAVASRSKAASAITRHASYENFLTLEKIEHALLRSAISRYVDLMSYGRNDFPAARFKRMRDCGHVNLIASVKRAIDAVLRKGSAANQRHGDRQDEFAPIARHFSILPIGRSEDLAARMPPPTFITDTIIP